MSRRLSYLSILGADNLNNSTPWIIIKEIAELYRIPYRYEELITSEHHHQLRRRIIAHPIVNINKPYSLDEYIHMAHYVNPNIEWANSNVLEEAFEYLWSFSNVKDYDINLDDLKFGLQTSSYPQSLNKIVCYKICIMAGFNLPLCVTTQQLYTYVSLYLRGPSNLIKYINVDNISEISNYIIDSIVSGNKFIINNDMDIEGNITNNNRNNNVYENIENIVENLTDETYLKLRIRPKNNTEAVVLAAINYELDISCATNPINEYNNLRNTISDIDTYDIYSYVPLDSYMKELLSLNPEIFSLRVTFNPRLPFNVYNDLYLNEIAINSGYKSDEIRFSSSYELLQLAYLEPGFYHGKYLTICNEVTPIDRENIEEIDNSEIICYGIVDSELKAMLYSELVETFNTTKSYLNPSSDKNSYFTKRDIRKLKCICNSIKPNDKISTINTKRDLVKAINYVNIYTKTQYRSAVELEQLYLESTLDIQEKIESVLIKILYMGMYMRNWKGHGSKYPIRSEDTQVDNQHLLDLRVTNSIRDLEDSIRELDELTYKQYADFIIENIAISQTQPMLSMLSMHRMNTYQENVDPMHVESDEDEDEDGFEDEDEDENGFENKLGIGSHILRLPLLIYSNYNFTISTEPSKGLTIGHRLEIVKSGTNGSIYSCLRMSSNWFVSSAYQYMQLIGLDPDFNINHLSMIS